MNITFYKNKYFSVCILIILFLLQFFAGYPGGMTGDSFDQFSQSLSLNFNSHHPSLMAMIWSGFNYIYKGPQTILFFHLSMFWLGTGLLYFSDTNNKYKWLYFVIPFLPNIFGELPFIWKDVGLGCSYLLVFSLSVYYLYQKDKAPFYIFILALLILFYGTSIKFQALFIAPIMLFFLITSLFKTKYLSSTIGTIILFSLFYMVNTSINNKIAINSQSWQYRQLFDIAAIINKTQDDSNLPQYLKNYTGYSLERVNDKFSHNIVNPLVYGEDKVFEYTLNTENLTQLNDYFFSMILKHPIIYAKHRMKNFNHLLNEYMKAKYFISYSNYQDFNKTLNGSEFQDIKIHNLDHNPVKIIVFNYMQLFHKFITRNLVSALIICIYLLYFIITFSYETNKERGIIFIIVIIGLAFSLTLLFTTMASDYRYYYLIRLLTFMSLPIFFKLVSRYRSQKLLEGVN